jgi:pantothenate kinase
MGTTKTAVKKGSSRKNPARGLVEKQASLINKLVNNIEEKIDANELKATLGDLIRLMQMQKEIEENQPREIRVTWVEKPDVAYETEA